MGLFSSRDKTTVGTSVQRVMEDKNIPNAPKLGVIKAIMSGGSVSDHLLDELMGSIGTRAERMYEYGAKSYIYGLPSGEIYAATQGSAEVQAVLNALVGEPVLLDYSRFGRSNTLHMGWMRLVNEYGYDSTNNELTVLSTQRGKKMYLSDMQVVIPASMESSLLPGDIEQWGIAPRAGDVPPSRMFFTDSIRALIQHMPVLIRHDASNEHVSIWVTYDNSRSSIFEGNGDNPLENFTLGITDPFPTSDYFHAKYFVNGRAHYWMYRAGEGTHPSLDALFNSPPTSMGSFYPFAYFRYGKRSMTEDKESQAYKSSKKLVKYLGMDYDTVVNAIHENPDIDDVEQAMMMLGVPAITEDPTERRYLFEFFDKLRLSQTPADLYRTWKLGQAQAAFSGNTNSATSTIVLQDSMFKMALSNEGIFKRRVGGNIGPIGSFSSAYGKLEVAGKVIDEWTGLPVDFISNIPGYYYRKQVSSAMYDEIQVVNLRMVYHIYGNYSTLAGGTAPYLLVPIDKAITAHYSIPDKELLYSSGLHYIFNSRVVTQVKWYQQDWFSAVVMTVAAIMAVFTFGQSWALAAGALAAGTTTLYAIQMAVAMGILKAVVVSVALKLFVQVVGAEFAFIVAVIAAVVAMGLSIQAGGLNQTPWANDLLSVSNGLVKSSSEAIQKSMEGLYEEAKAFGVYTEEQNNLLETANDLLANDNILSPLIIMGEKPSDYYSRTVHAGNLGAASIKSVSTFVRRSLQLPTIDQTLGSNFYGRDRFQL